MEQKYLDLVNASNYQKLGLLYPDVRVRVIRLYQDMYANFQRLMRCTHSLRSIDEQQALYNQGRKNNLQVVTRAKPMQSWHNYGCAIDSCFAGLDPYLEKEDKDSATFAWSRYGSLGEAHGMKWGKNWHDLPHLELSYGVTISEAQDLYESGGIKAVWAKFDTIRGVRIASEWETKIVSIEKTLNGG